MNPKRQGYDCKGGIGYRKPETETGNGNGNGNRKPETETGNRKPENGKRKPVRHTANSCALFTLRV